MEMQGSASQERNKAGRRESTDRRHQDLRCESERRDEINRRHDMISVMEPEDRINDERRTDQLRRDESRRKTIRRDGRDRRDN